MRFESNVNDNSFEIELKPGSGSATINGDEVSFEFIQQLQGRKLLRAGTKLYRIDNVTVNGQQVSFSIDGKWFNTEVKNDRELLLERLGFKSHTEISVGSLNAPMPGKILNLLVSVNDQVELGQPVAILEAMKMENELKAPCSGTISEILVSENDSVEKNQPLIEIEPGG